jgi:regulator of sirC expression with transglutaminase-like and TPR domain
VRSSFDDSPEFRRLLAADPSADLTRIALEIARDAYPGLDAERYLHKISALADRARDRCAPGTRLRPLLGHINWVLFIEERFRGDDEQYYDPRNSYLNQVIDRRSGIPITLSTLYLAVAQRLGLEMSGVNLPAHFVLRAGSGTEAVFVDAYHGGQLLDREGCERRVAQVTGQDVRLPLSAFAPCPPTTIVARLLRNLKGIYLREHNFEAALPVLRRLVALEPSDAVERRDLGVACLHADRPGEAVEHLQDYLDRHPQATDVSDVKALIDASWREIASRN